MVGEGGGLLDPSYGGDPLAALGDELRERGGEEGLVLTQVP